MVFDMEVEERLERFADEINRRMIEYLRERSDRIRRYYDNEFEQMDSDTSCLDEFFNEMVVCENDIG